MLHSRDWRVNMGYVIKVLPHALEQIADILNYISEELKSPKAASNLYERIKEELTIIEQYPLSKSKVSWDEESGVYRKFLINNYVGVYRIDASEKTIYVLAFRYAPSSMGDRI